MKPVPKEGNLHLTESTQTIPDSFRLSSFGQNSHTHKQLQVTAHCFLDIDHELGTVNNSFAEALAISQRAARYIKVVLFANFSIPTEDFNTLQLSINKVISNSLGVPYLDWFPLGDHSRLVLHTPQNCQSLPDSEEFVTICAEATRLAFGSALVRYYIQLS